MCREVIHRDSNHGGLLFFPLHFNPRKQEKETPRNPSTYRSGHANAIKIDDYFFIDEALRLRNSCCLAFSSWTRVARSLAYSLLYGR